MYSDTYFPMCVIIELSEISKRPLWAELRASSLSWNVPKEKKLVSNCTRLMEPIPSLKHFCDQVKNRYRLEG
jgi:hypothetical protein